MEYEKHDCGGEIIDDKPHYIPLGSDSIMQIIDQKCTKCGALIIGKYQKTTIIENQELHDKLHDLMAMSLHS
jgi:hypothetical protein